VAVMRPEFGDDVDDAEKSTRTVSFSSRPSRSIGLKQPPFLLAKQLRCTGTGVKTYAGSEVKLLTDDFLGVANRIFPFQICVEKISGDPDLYTKYLDTIAIFRCA
jgi:hypothetical protein